MNKKKLTRAVKIDILDDKNVSLFDGDSSDSSEEEFATSLAQNMIDKHEDAHFDHEDPDMDDWSDFSEQPNIDNDDDDDDVFMDNDYDSSDASDIEDENKGFVNNNTSNSLKEPQISKDYPKDKKQKSKEKKSKRKSAFVDIDEYEELIKDASKKVKK